jgi:hypothetical protein
MQTLRRNRGSRTHALLAVLLVPMLLAGIACSRSGPRQHAEQAPQDTDVYRVVCFYPPNMWRSFDVEGDLNPEGFAFVMYLISQQTNKGVFADGTFWVEIYQRGPLTDSGRRPRHLVFESSAPMRDLPRRTPTLLRNGYQPTVYWGDLELYGADIEIVIKYESPTGRIVSSETISVKVPERKV